MRLATVLCLTTLFAGCATYEDALSRGQHAYGANDYELALAIFRNLEPDTDSLEPKERSGYAYFRGMTDFRLNYRSDARHWLAVAQVLDKANPGGLDADQLRRLDETLAVLNAEVYRTRPAFADSDSKFTEKTRRTVTEKPAPGHCAAKADCPAGNTCQAGECVPE